MRTYWFPILGLVAIIAFNALFTPGFLEVVVRDGRLYGSLIDVVNRSAPVLLLAVGMTLVIATGGVDLSVGAVMAVSGAVAAVLLARPESSTAFAVMAGLAAALLAGAFNGVLVGKIGIQPIVATLVLMVAGRGVAQMVTGGQIAIFRDPGFEFLGTGAVAGIPMPVLLSVGTMALVALAVRNTALGLFIEASGSNSRAARLAGVPSDKIKIAVYALCGLTAGLAGLIECADIRGADANNAGLYMELDAILAVAVGGTSLAGGRMTLLGTVFGVWMMQALTTTILTRGVSPHATLVAKAVLIVIVIVAQSPNFAAMRLRRSAQ